MSLPKWAQFNFSPSSSKYKKREMFPNGIYSVSTTLTIVYGRYSDMWQSYTKLKRVTSENATRTCCYYSTTLTQPLNVFLLFYWKEKKEKKTWTSILDIGDIIEMSKVRALKWVRKIINLRDLNLRLKLRRCTKIA